LGDLDSGDDDESMMSAEALTRALRMQNPDSGGEDDNQHETQRNSARALSPWGSASVVASAGATPSSGRGVPASSSFVQTPRGGGSSSGRGSGSGSASLRGSSFSTTSASASAARSSRAEGSGLLVMDSAQMEQLKLHFRDPTSGRFDRALTLNEFVEAFAAVLAHMDGSGGGGGGNESRSRKVFKQMFMKIDANSDGSVDWDEFTNFMLSEESSGASGAAAAADGTNHGGGGGGGKTASAAGAVTFVRNHRFDQVEVPHSTIPRMGERAIPGSTIGIGTIQAGGVGGGAAGPGSSAAALLLLDRSRAASAAASAASSRKSTFHTGMIVRLVPLPVSDRFVTGARDGMLKVWTGADLSHVRTIRAAPCWITDVCVLRASNRIAVCSMDR
jgi:hypothetical protein